MVATAPMESRAGAVDGGEAKMIRPGMRISAIAAMAQNRVIGRDGGIPWRIPGEQSRFKRITLGHTVIMGRKTYESLGRPLVERTNIVVTRQAGLRLPGCLTAASLAAAFALCPAAETEAFVIGGGQLYTEALPSTDRIYLSVLPRAVDGDTYFPEFSEQEFGLSSREHVGGPEPYEFLVYDRVHPRQGPRR
jgi:dihydrofolate reductase